MGAAETGTFSFKLPVRDVSGSSRSDIAVWFGHTLTAQVAAPPQRDMANAAAEHD